MPINLLRRFGFNAPSTPYSSCRSNIEHATYFESTNYSKLLEPCQILKVNGFSSICYINTAKISSPIFTQGRHRYFELTHHDPNSKEDAEKIEKRINRIIELQKSDNPCIIFYNHRSSSGFKRALPELELGLNYILKKFRNSTAICITQKLISQDLPKTIEVKQLKKNMIFATFCTYRKWEGNDLDVFFGKIDDDLFAKFFSYIDTVITKQLGDIK